MPCQRMCGAKLLGGSSSCIYIAIPPDSPDLTLKPLVPPSRYPQIRMEPGDEAVFQESGSLVLADVCVKTATAAAEKVPNWGDFKL